MFFLSYNQDTIVFLTKLSLPIYRSSLQHHVQKCTLRHGRDYGQKAVVLVEA